MQRHPLPDADTNCGNFVLAAVTLFRSLDPDTNAIATALTAHIEGGEGAYNPFFQSDDKPTDVRQTSLKIEHDICDPLSRAVIGKLAASAGLENRKAGINDVGHVCAGTGRVERRVLQKPDKFSRSTCRYR